MSETVEHFIFDCDRYSAERKELEESVDNILAREGKFCQGTLKGETEARSEIVGALLNFIKCTKRFN